MLTHTVITIGLHSRKPGRTGGLPLRSILNFHAKAGATEWACGAPPQVLCRSTGDIMTVINKRRGTVLGMNPSEEEQGMTELDAQMPQSEITDLATVIRQITRGLGHFTAQFDHYEQLPQALEADVIANAPKFSEYEG